MAEARKAGGSGWAGDGYPQEVPLQETFAKPSGGCPEDPHPNPLPQGEGARATASLGTRDRLARVSTRDRLTANEPGASTGRGRLVTGLYEGSGGSSNWAAWRSR